MYKLQKWIFDFVSSKPEATKNYIKTHTAAPTRNGYTGNRTRAKYYDNSYN